MGREVMRRSIYDGDDEKDDDILMLLKRWVSLCLSSLQGRLSLILLLPLVT